MSWNKYVIFIENPYHISTKHFSKGKFCPMGIINPDRYCILPCFFFDTPYCTNMIYTEEQEKATKDWLKNNKIDF